MMRSKHFLIPLIFSSLFLPAGLVCLNAQALQKKKQTPTAYFIDGYHGGIWGHFPDHFASYMATQMRRHPDWKINLEIEPVTWDSIATADPEGYQYFQAQLKDSSAAARVEYVNPAYGQPYMFNISGESIIRQLYYGMRTLRRHFPGICFSTYSSEEPCFTSQLPGILRSFGFKYASLKNPNTCWGGYTKGHPGALVYWTGPDGRSILTVPRYESEKLQKGSTWQTTGWRNSQAYVQSALSSGVKWPVGMCLQDAGWKVGPWLGQKDTSLPLDKKGTGQYPNSVYTTWRGYFSKVRAAMMTGDGKAAATAAESAKTALKDPTSPSIHTNELPIPHWPMSQQDIRVSLVWGGQILQRVARAVRKSENRLIAAETLATFHHLFRGDGYPYSRLDKAWKNLLLSQHHDCWIVPYNKKHGQSWQWQVNRWTDSTLQIADSLIWQPVAKTSANSTLDVHPTGKRQLQNHASRQQVANTGGRLLKIYNTTGRPRTATLCYVLPEQAGAGSNSLHYQLLDPMGHPVNFQLVDSPAALQPAHTALDTSLGHSQQKAIYFEATVPAMGFATYRLVKSTVQNKKSQYTAALRQSKRNRQSRRPIIRVLSNGHFQMNTARYLIEVDPEKGGAITRLKLKSSHQIGVNNAAVMTHDFISDSGTGKSAKAGLNILRGYFYNQHRFYSSSDEPARVSILANGPLFAALKIQGSIAGVPFTQILRLSQHDPLIKTKLIIDWTKWPGDAADLGIGAYKQVPFLNQDPRKAFYNSRYKLQTMFQVNFKGARIIKDAPFDLFASPLKSTFFDRWDQIKNDVLLHWVDLVSSDNRYGFALFSTATTSYAHGPGLPLGLTTQYIGRGLFGADYGVDGPTVMAYAFMPHTAAGPAAKNTSRVNPAVTQAAEDYNKPLIVTDLGRVPDENKPQQLLGSVLELPANSGWHVSAFKMADHPVFGNKQGTFDSRNDAGTKNKAHSYLLRLFNQTGDERPGTIRLKLPKRLIKRIELVDLSGRSIKQLGENKNRQTFTLCIPHLGIRNIRITFW